MNDNLKDKETIDLIPEAGNTYTEGIDTGGNAAVILKNGVPVTITEILNGLNQLDRIENYLADAYNEGTENDEEDNDLVNIGEFVATELGYL